MIIAYAATLVTLCIYALRYNNNNNNYAMSAGQGFSELPIL